MRLPRLRAVRTRLLLAVIAAVALSLTLLTLAFNLALARSLDRNANGALRARAAAELAVLKPERGRLVIGEAPDDAAVGTPIWVFSRGRLLEAPAVNGAVDQAARALDGGRSRFANVPARQTRLYAVPVVVGSRRLGTVVSGVSLVPYEQTKHTALIGSLALAVVLLLLVVPAASWLLAAALRPVARMTAAASAWSERDLDRRFDLGEPHDELSSLAATLDELLDRIAASLRRERHFSAELSHELLTPLANVVAETELALGRERVAGEYQAALRRVQKSALQLTRTVQALLAAARHEAEGGSRGTSDAYAAAAAVVEACAVAGRARELSVVASRPAGAVRLGVELDFAERILQPVVENACRYARSRVHVSLARAEGHVTYVVADDGPGVASDESDAIFEPRARGRAGRSNRDGAGLGLALARRLARSAQGDVVAAPDERGGRFVVTLPAG